MTNGRRRTIDIDITQQQHHHHQSESHARAMTISFPPVRSQRRLHKWSDKTDELTTVTEDDNEMNDDDNGDNDENGPLVQSLSAMASHLMNNKGSNNGGGGEDSDNSPEKDVYITEKGTTPLDDQDNTESDTEETASEEDSTDQADTSGNNNERKHGGDLNDVGGEEEDEEAASAGESDQMSAKLKSDHYSTTPKGLTTWHSVNDASQGPMYHVSKVTGQKMPAEYTISSVLSFSTERPHTTPEMVVIKERVTSTEPTTRMTAKVSLMPPSSSSSTSALKNKRKPFNNKNKKVPPSKFVKPQLEDVTAEVTSVGDTHVVYKTKVSTERPEMKTSSVTDYYDRFTTKKPLWPYQMTTRRVVTKRPPFSRVTTRPKNPYAKRPQSSLSMTTPTTTTPASTTTYLRNPQTAIISPISGLTLSLTDIPFMDFVRSQIIPRIGLTLISFMASTPLLLSLLGAAGLRRRKRSADDSSSFSVNNGRALFESQKRAFHQNPSHNVDEREQSFDFSTIQKKLEDAMKQPLRRKIGNGNNNSSDDGFAPQTQSSFDLIAEAFRHLARWWATKSAPPKTRTVNNRDEGKH